MTEFLVWAATRSQLFAHQLLWNMQANKYTDEESKHFDEGLAGIVTVISEYIISSFNGECLFDEMRTWKNALCRRGGCFL